MTPITVFLIALAAFIMAPVVIDLMLILGLYLNKKINEGK